MQTKLFYEDEYQALELMLAHGCKTAKELAVFLFPDRKPESAYARLKACLNADKDERLTFGQIVAAMNFCQAYDPLEDVPGVLGFSRLELLQGYERGLERRDEGRMDGIDRAEVLAHVRTLIVQERLSPKLRRASR